MDNAPSRRVKSELNNTLINDIVSAIDPETLNLLILGNGNLRDIVAKTLTGPNPNWKSEFEKAIGRHYPDNLDIDWNLAYRLYTNVATSEALENAAENGYDKVINCS
jgi:hypothetical protein